MGETQFISYSVQKPENNTKIIALCEVWRYGSLYSKELTKQSGTYIENDVIDWDFGTNDVYFNPVVWMPKQETESQKNTRLRL